MTASDPNKTTPVHILLADDDDVIREGLAQWLRRTHGFEVDTASSGTEALDRMERSDAPHYDVLLLDQVFKEGANGLDVLALVKARQPDLPVIMLTGQEPEVAARTLLAGAFRCLIKPFANEELAASIREALRKYDERLNQLCAVVAEALEVPLCLIWLLDETRDHFEIHASFGPVDDVYRQTVTLDYYDEPLQRFLQKGTPAYLSNVTRARAYGHVAEAHQRHWRSLLSVSLIAQGRVVGILDAYSMSRVKRFTPPARRLFQVFADQATAIIYEDQIVHKARALAEISRALSGTYDVNSVLDAILGQVLPLVGADIGQLYLLDREIELLEIRAQRGLALSDAGRVHKLGKGLAGRVAQTGTARLIPDDQADKPDLAEIGPGIRSEIVVPLKYEYTIMGVLVAGSKHLNAFTEDDLATLTDFAAQAALAVERDRLNQHLQQMSELASTDDLAALLDYIVKAVYNLTGFPVAMWRVDDRTGTQATIQAYRQMNSDYIHDRTLDPKQSSIAEAIRTLQAVEIEDIRNDPRLSARTKLEAEKQGWESLLILPILAEPGRAFGTLGVYTSIKRRFTPRERGLLNTLVRQAGLAFRNAGRLQMIRQLSESGRRLNTLQVSPDTLEQKLQQIADTALEILEADIVDLYQYDPAAKDFVLPPIMAGARRHPEYVTNPETFTKDAVVWQIIQSKQPLYEPNAQAKAALTETWKTQRAELPEQRFVFREDIVSLAAIRLVVAEGQQQIPVGVLFVNYRWQQDFSEIGLKERIETFAGEAAVALQNARLLQREQRHRRGHQALHEIGNELINALEEDVILDIVIRTASDALAGTHCTVFRLKGDNLVLEVVYGKESGSKLGRTFKLGQGLAGWVAQERRSALVPDTTKDLRYEPGWSNHNVSSLVLAPIMLDDQVYGVISVELDRADAFDQYSVTLLETLAAQTSIAIKNAKLFAKERAKSLQLTQLHSALDQVMQTLDLENVLSLIVEGVTTILGQGSSSSIYLYNSEKREFYAGQAAGPAKEFLEVGLPRTTGGASITAIEKQQALFVDDADVHPLRRPDTVGQPIRSFACVPLLAGAEPLGTLYVRFDNVKHPFSEDERLVLELFASRAVIALQNAKYFAQIKADREERIKAIREIGFRITAGLNLDAILDDVLARTLPLMKEASSGEIWLLDEPNEKLIAWAARGSLQPTGRELPITAGVVGWVARTRTWRLVGDVEQDEYFARRSSETCSELAVPLMQHDRLIGVLNIEHPQIAAFSEEDVPLLEAIAVQVVIALENAQMYRELQNHAERLVHLQRITADVLAKAESPDRVWKMIATQIAGVFGASYCTIRPYDSQLNQFGESMRFEGSGERNISSPPRPDGLSQYVLQEKKAVYAQDVSARLPSGQPVIRLEHQARGTKAIACFPLLVDDEVVGRLAVAWSEPHQFSDSDKSMLALYASQAAVSIKISHLYGQLTEANQQLVDTNKQLDYLKNRKIRDLKAVYEVSQQLTSAIQMSVQDILVLIHEQTRPLMDTNNMYIALYDEKTDEVSFPLMYVDGQPASVAPRRGGKGRTEWIIRQREPVFIRTKDESVAWYQALGRQEYLGDPLASWLGVPMMAGDKVLGVIATYHKTADNIYDEDDQEVLELMASQAAIVLQNARMWEAMQKLSEDLSAGALLD